MRNEPSNNTHTYLMPEASSEGILEVGRLRHGSAAREPPGMQTRFNIPGCFGPTLSLSLSHQVVPGSQYHILLPLLSLVTVYVIGKRAEPITTYSLQVLWGLSMYE